MLKREHKKLLLDLIEDEIGVERERLIDSVSFFHDLGVAGIDGFDLIERIGDQFNIDVSEVPWHRYFGDELPYNPIYHLVCFLQGKRLDHDVVRLEISHIKKTIKAGVWHEPN